MKAGAIDASYAVVPVDNGGARAAEIIAATLVACGAATPPDAQSAADVLVQALRLNGVRLTLEGIN